ncbi:MAG: hypothetical protein ABEK42_13730, partial [Thiohalorhabdaceae bacterium]
MNPEQARELARKVLEQGRSKVTLRDYQKKVSRLKQANQSPREYAEAHGLSRATYYAYRAAWLHNQAAALKMRLGKLDRARKVGNPEQVRRLREEIAELAKDVAEADPDRTHRKRPDSHPGYQGPAKRRRSARPVIALRKNSPSFRSFVRCP